MYPHPLAHPHPPLVPHPPTPPPRAGIEGLLEQSPLDDMALDIPTAPRLLGRLVGAAAGGNLLGLDFAGSVAAAVESAEPRRAFLAAAFKGVQEAGGDERLQQLVGEGKLDLPKLLAADPEFDPADLPAPADFLRQQGLAVLA